MSNNACRVRVSRSIIDEPCAACGISDRCKLVVLSNGSRMVLCAVHRGTFDAIIAGTPIDGPEDMREEEANHA